jgi:hypothetical protein
MPLEIRKLIDTLSIKREYLTSYVKMDRKFVDTMLSGLSLSDKYDVNCTSSYMIDDNYLSDTIETCLSTNAHRKLYYNFDNSISDYWNEDITYSSELDDEKFNHFITHLFYTHLKSKLKQTYNDKNETYIYKYLSNNILLSNFELVNDKKDIIDSYRILYNIPYTFNVQNEVDKYENGEVILSDYTDQELQLLSIEIERRKEPFKQNELKTRYKFYKEKELKEYSEFI